MIYKPREDSFLLEKEVVKCSKGKKVLDVGTGTGIQALAAKKAGAKSVLACDVYEPAVKHVNFIGIKCIKSNLFSKIKGKYDLIIFNPPYLPLDDREDPESALATTGGKRGDEIILKFLENVKDYLNKKGKILLLMSSLTPKEKIFELMNEQKFDYGVLSEEKCFFEKLEVWLIENRKP